MEFQSKSRNNFASVGADGSLRLFDLRNLNHSTITYESPDLVPLLRLSWNPLDTNYLATMMLDSNKVIIIDIRVPSYPATELTGHTQAVNAFSWSPESSSHIATCGEDKQVYVNIYFILFLFYFDLIINYLNRFGTFRRARTASRTCTTPPRTRSTPYSGARQTRASSPPRPRTTSASSRSNGW